MQNAIKQTTLKYLFTVLGGTFWQEKMWKEFTFSLHVMSLIWIEGYKTATFFVFKES